MITLSNINKTYTDPNDTSIPVLNAISFTINKTDHIAITGPSGSGKSTLLRIISGLEQPSQGDVHIQNASVYRMNDTQRATMRAKTFGFVFQSFRLIPELSAIENIELACNIAGQPTEAAMHWLQTVDLENRAHHFPHMLSGGEQQRVAFARAMAANPAVIVADEPTGNLDPKNSARIQTLLAEHCKHKCLILVTHNPTLASICSTQTVLENGSLIFQ